MKRLIFLFRAILMLSGFFTISANSHDILPSTPFRDTNIAPSTAKKIDDPVVSGGLNAVVNAYKIWGAGETLNVCFVGGTAEVKQFFVDTEREWEKYAFIKWDFGSAPDFRVCDSAKPSHIRVSFEHTGHWSRVGTDAINKQIIDSPSLNIDVQAFGVFSLANKIEVRSVMLHEQGHALGMEHEHQSPNDPCIAHIKWSKVYVDMAAPPNQWDQQKVDQNFKALVKTDRLRTTEYDKTSIMHYSFPANWFDTPTCVVGHNNEISKLDQQEIQLAYPANPNDQASYFAKVSKPAQTAVAALALSDGDKKGLQQDINEIRNHLDGRLAGAVRTASVGGNNSGIFVSGNVDIKTTGNCSAAIVGAQQVEIKCDK